jgi:TonB family protein
MMPTVLSEVALRVPADSAAGGDVDVEVVIDTNGAVAHARVASVEPGRAALEQAALAAARGWRFRAAVDRETKPVATLAILRTTVTPGASGSTTRSVIMPPPRHANPLTDGPPPPRVVYTVGTPGIRFPTVAREIRPDYTDAAVRAKVVGMVTMSALVLADGTVGSAMVTKPLHPELDREALAAARYWLFEPAVLNGQPVPFVVTLELEFRLH